MICILTSWGRWDDEVLNRKFSTEEEAVSVMEKEYNIWNVSKKHRKRMHEVLFQDYRRR